MSIYEYDQEKHMQQEREEWEEIGWKKGLEKGEEIGRKAGETIGREVGRAEGEERMSRLIQNLLSAGRVEELERVVSDEELKEKLFQEFGI